MNRNDLRNRYPAHTGHWSASTPTPAPKPDTFARVMANIIYWGILVAAGAAIVLGLFRAASRMPA